MRKEGSQTRFKNWKYPEFDKNGMTVWNWMCQYRANLKLGKNTDIGAFTYINAEYGVEIEEDVQIGSGCRIYSVNTIDNTRGKVVVKKAAKIGANSVVLPGITIGENAVVGALSLVKTNIPKDEIWGGLPTRKIGEIIDGERKYDI